MLRAARARHDREVVDGFRMRGLEVTRLESFADAVFGFALTLLVVSLDVPKDFNHLLDTMRGFPAFAVCFLLLTLIWNVHYKFCRRYGLDDGMTRFLTCVLLFFVLFYVYPLKFLFSLSNSLIVQVGPGTDAGHVTSPQLSLLLIIYGLGLAAVYLALCLLYLHAYRLRDALELSALERLDTRYFIYRMAAMVGVGLAAAGLVWTHWVPQWGGFIYFAIFPIMRTLGIIHRRHRAPLRAAASDR